MARIDDHFEAFLAERRASGLRPAGERAFRDAWAAFRRLPGSYRPDWEVTRLLFVGSSSDEIYRRRRLLLPVLTFLQSRKVIGSCPLPQRPSPRRVEGRPTLTESETMRLIHAIPDTGVRVLAGLVYFTGLRAERLTWLKPEDVDEANLTIHVPDGWQTRAGPLSRDAAELVTLWRRRRREQVTYLLHDRYGRPLTLQYASATLRTAGERVGNPALGFGHLQYAHARLLAATFPLFNQALLEVRMQQPFRLRYLRIPNLYDEEVLSYRPTHLAKLLKGEPE